MQTRREVEHRGRSAYFTESQPELQSWLHSPNMSKTHPLDLEEFHRTTKWVTHFVEQTCSTDYPQFFVARKRVKYRGLTLFNAKFVAGAPVKKPKYSKYRHHDGDTSRYLEIQFLYRSVRRCLITDHWEPLYFSELAETRVQASNPYLTRVLGWMCILFDWKIKIKMSLLFDYICNNFVCICHLFHGPLRECLRARRFWASLLLRLPPVLVPAVLGALAVWIQNQKNKKGTSCFFFYFDFRFFSWTDLTSDFSHWSVLVPAVLGALRARQRDMRYAQQPAQYVNTSIRSKNNYLYIYMHMKKNENNRHKNCTWMNAMNTKLISVSGVCCWSQLRVYTCVSCSISILFLYMYVRMPSSPGSIAGVPSSQALPSYLITAPPSMYAFAIYSVVHCGSAFEPGASGLPHSCASTCARSCCNWRASSVDLKPKKKSVNVRSYCTWRANCVDPNKIKRIALPSCVNTLYLSGDLTVLTSLRPQWAFLSLSQTEDERVAAATLQIQAVPAQCFADFDVEDDDVDIENEMWATSILHGGGGVR